MSSLSKPQLYVLLAAVILFVLLFIAPRKLINLEKDPLVTTNQDELNSFVDSVKKSLTKEELIFVSNQEINSSPSKDSLFKFWISKKQPILAAGCIENLAEKIKSDSLWSEAGKLYFKSIGFSNQNLSELLFNSSTRCYEKALAIAPQKASHKIGLASCYVSGSSEPMKGITLLKEVLALDSNNFEAHLSLGMFAIQSKQFEKAVKRFNKLLVLNPNYLETYLFLGQTYASMGNKKDAISNLNIFKTKSTDTQINKEVDDYINQLKN